MRPFEEERTAGFAQPDSPQTLIDDAPRAICAVVLVAGNTGKVANIAVVGFMLICAVLAAHLDDDGLVHILVIHIVMMP